MATFRRPIADRAISEYLEFLDQHPSLRRDRDRLQLVTTESELHKFKNEYGDALGLLVSSPFGVVLVDLVEESGHRFPYIRFVPANPSQDSAGVVILATTVDGDVVFVESFRHATGAVHLELPRGFTESGEDPCDAAVRELEEETGFVGVPKVLGHSFTDTGLSASKVTYVHVSVETDVAASPELAEAIIDVSVVPFGSVNEMIRNGKLLDGFALQAIALYGAQAEGS